MGAIDDIVSLSGPLPDTEGFKRYLGTLTKTELQARLTALRESQQRTGKRFARTRAGRMQALGISHDGVSL